MAKRKKIINLSSTALASIKLIRAAGGFSSDNAAIEAAIMGEGMRALSLLERTSPAVADQLTASLLSSEEEE